MKHIPVKLNKRQYLSEIEPFKTKGIPTNSIIHKTIPGCGATTLEIEHTKRNSIIILPNVPVIEAKVKAYNKDRPKEEHIIGIYKGIDVSALEDYINSEATYKKILTTPEGFMSKVLLAFTNDLETMKKDYFLLFDECERIITDVSYRGKISAPVNWFLKFRNKAMVSATTLSFSHKGFDGFDHYVIEPQYDYSKAIKVILTNNVIESTEGKLKALDSKHPVFIFLNSTDGINATMDTLGIKQRSHVYCAERSVALLSRNKFKKAYSDFNIDDLAEYNLLTSRYFSAFDIKLNYKPDVILITDVFTAEHTVLDPHTEIIQIAGRFRDGINSLTHISNFNPLLESKSIDEATEYLRGCFDTYEDTVTRYHQTTNAGSKATLKDFLDKSPIADFYIEDELNPFMVDNFHYQHRVQGYYQSPENLKKAYAEVPKHFKPEYIPEEYPVSDEDRIRRLSRATIREQQWETLRQIDKFAPKSGQFILHNSYTLVNNLRSLYPWLTEAYDLIGLEGIEKVGLKTTKLNPVKARARELNDLRKLAPLVYAVFDEHSEPEDRQIKLLMAELCKKANVALTPTTSLILKFFEGDRTTKRSVHIHKLRNKIDLVALTPFD